MTSVIVVDIGNSRIACAEFSGGILTGTWHYATTEVLLAGEDFCHKDGRLVISSVVPEANNNLIALLEKEKRPFEFVSGSKQTLIKGVYATMGSDRVANAVAGWKLYGQENPVVILDLGTATTLTAVSQTGTFEGGMITLGLGRILSALATGTGQLPDLAGNQLNAEADPLACDTESAIWSGTLLGHVGLLEFWVKKVRRRSGQKMTVVATGGWSKLISRHSQVMDHIDPHLTLKGIYLMSAAAEDRVDRAQSTSRAPSDT